jgi:hypothetical protein
VVSDESSELPSLKGREPMSFFRRQPPVLNEERVLEIARAEAARHRWDWVEPVRAWTFRDGWFRGPIRWQVKTNADSIGYNVWVTVDDATGTVRSANFLPR